MLVSAEVAIALVIEPDRRGRQTVNRLEMLTPYRRPVFHSETLITGRKYLSIQ
jgi:hypothetical protein